MICFFFPVSQAPLPTTILEAMDKIYNITAKENADVKSK